METIKAVTFKLSEAELETIDRMVEEQDSDRSKFIRRAVREYIKRQAATSEE